MLTPASRRSTAQHAVCDWRRWGWRRSTVMHTLVGEGMLATGPPFPSFLQKSLTGVHLSILRHASLQIFPLYSPQLHIAPLLKYSAIQHYVEKVQPYSLWLRSILLLSFPPISWISSLLAAACLPPPFQYLLVITCSPCLAFTWCSLPYPFLVVLTCRSSLIPPSWLPLLPSQRVPPSQALVPLPLFPLLSPRPNHHHSPRRPVSLPWSLQPLTSLVR